MNAQDSQPDRRHQSGFRRGQGIAASSLEFEEEEELRLENEQLLGQQADLERSRDTYFQIYDQAPIPLLILDVSGVVRCANQAAADLLGRERNHLIGRWMRLLVHSVDRRSWGRFLHQVWREESEVLIARLIAPDGRLLPARINARPLFGPGMDGIQVALQDLRHEREEEREQRRLIQAERLAREESHAKDRLIATLSHELRTPLTPVLALASALKCSTSLSSQLRETFSLIERNIQTEARLVDDLLDVTSLSRGRVLLAKQCLDLKQLVLECVEQFEPAAIECHVELTARWEAEHSTVDGDPVRLRQVFYNLLKNALKFTPVDGHVVVRGVNRDETVTVEVADDGLGFDPAEATRLFDPFEQGVRPSRGEGLGLGLAICKGIVDLHDGYIEAASTGPGQGAQFSVALAVVPDVALARATGDPTPAGSEPAPPPLPEAGGKPRLLLVEDHSDTAEVLAELLEGQGFVVIVADSIHEAVAISLDRVDLIISDVGMPDGSGFDLIRQLRVSSGLPAIALSGFGMAADITRAQEAGFDLYLTKPAEIHVLVEAIRGLLDRAGGMEVAGSPAQDVGANS